MNEVVKYFATGRRKESVARIQLMPGGGQIKVNGKAFEVYFPIETLRTVILQPLAAAEKAKEFDVKASVSGGGISGQAGAIRHAIARALVKADAGLRPLLRKCGYLTRDPRMKERKKFGQKGARRRFQWTKR